MVATELRRIYSPSSFFLFVFVSVSCAQMIGVTGLGFFASNIFAGTMAPVAALLGTTPLMLSVLLGATQNILSKSSKYSLFDPCKEMAYIPLDQESKTKGKAAIEVVGNPLGKSGGALIQQVLIFGVGSLAAATPYLAGILLFLVFFWYRASNSLAKQFNTAMSAFD
jgi:AAA family ATP:ADP antiporter